MFKNKRYCTSGIADRVPLCTQAILWGLVDNMEVESKDYFQVFKLSVFDGQQRIIHEQEIPEYKKIYDIALCGASPVVGKIYVIDSETYSTMLFAEEY
ncbi:MAG: DUF960 domain-containing protein [Clostridia bacterium]|nr:DUF960 domain-containing protein [Clostridia bacterium]